MSFVRRAVGFEIKPSATSGMVGGRSASHLQNYVSPLRRQLGGSTGQSRTTYRLRKVYLSRRMEEGEGVVAWCELQVECV